MCTFSDELQFITDSAPLVWKLSSQNVHISDELQFRHRMHSFSNENLCFDTKYDPLVHDET